MPKPSSGSMPDSPTVADSGDRAEIRRFRAEAGALAKAFGERLRGELTAAMASGGPVQAIEVCSQRAPEIAREISTDTLAIRRIGTRVRNKATNTPTASQRSLLNRLSATTPEYAGVVDGRLTYLRAIILQDAVCLNCHGPRESLAPEVLAKLAERYPDDEATGYAAGDLRGAFVVESRDSPAAQANVPSVP